MKFVQLLIVAAVLVLAGFDSCGGMPTPGTNNNSYDFGQRLGAVVSMQPGPPSYTFPSWSGDSPGIRIDQVQQFSSTAHPTGTDINQVTTQVVFGQVTGPIGDKVVVVYSYTNNYYVQPLTSTTINIAGDLTWTAPANPGNITELLVKQGYSLPDTTSSLPAIDSVNVFAMAGQ